MSKLKSQIARIEADLDANSIHLHEEYHQLLQNSHTVPMVYSAVIGSLVVGFIAGRYGKVNLKTVATVPFTINRLLTAAELLLDIKKPR